CGGGREEAAVRCAAYVRRAGPVSRGSVRLVMRRFGPTNFACEGQAVLRQRRGAGLSYGTADFLFPYGVTDVSVRARLTRAARTRVARARRGISASAGTRVEGQRFYRHQRVTLRRASR
ncbi:MAG TPA: hypothetical protein VFZ89_16715, partial [Solirubrobacteraceae bacterium]